MGHMNICWTLNNYTLEEQETIEARAGNDTYTIYGMEVGEEGTHHLQGYTELKTRTRLTTLKKKWGDRFHFEERRGTQEQAIEYCKKDGDWIEFGQRRISGARPDLDRCRQLAHDQGMRAVTGVCNLQQIRVAEKYLTYNEEPRDWKPEVIWIWGESGVGKSRRAREIFATDDIYTKNESSKWWDGYDNHENIIIDDFRDSWWPMTEMLRLLDRYECRIECKGGTRQFRPRRICITCTRGPNEMYRQVDEQRHQLLRRIDRIEHLEAIAIVNNEVAHEVGEVILELPI
nr:MAG: replication associated protein [Cressdnaviricota sp.]